MPTTYTALVGTSADLFPGILGLYVRPGFRVADVTYGRGVFWRKADPTRYDLRPTDLAGGVDLRALPYPDGWLDALILDPPFLPTPYTGRGRFADWYGVTPGSAGKKWAAAVLDLYRRGMAEADRVLARAGVLIVKCQDLVCGGRQVLVHCDLVGYAAGLGWRCEDLFVLVQPNRRPHPRERQVHARKNHSYFLVFVRARRGKGARPASHDRRPASPGRPRYGRGAGEAAVVARVVRWRAGGWSFQRIADALNRDGVPTASGRRWHRQTVKNVCDRGGLPASPGPDPPIPPADPSV